MPLTNRSGSRLPEHYKHRRSQRGITLLESMVSILILSVAVLSMLGVQLRTLSETQTSVRRAQAVRLIEDLGERIKSNPGDFGQLTAYVSGWSDTPTGTDCLTAGCTPLQLAAWDVQQWKQSVVNALPNAQANIFLSPNEDSNPDNRRQLGVMVGWRVNERNVTDASNNYLKFFNETPSGTPVTCPAGLICHLVYVQP